MIDLILAGLFSDHMVLQRGRNNPIWGWDRPGQVITLHVEGVPQEVPDIQVHCGADGFWKLQCPQLPTGGPYKLHIHGSNRKIIDDVKVGDVWLAGGQSNMEWPLQNTTGGPEDVQASANPDIRLFKVPRTAAKSPQRDVEGSWLPAQPLNSGSFSAIAYHFAKSVSARYKIPVGVISDNWGGTRVEAWVSRQGLVGVMDLKAEDARQADIEQRMPQLVEAYNRKVLAWESLTMPRDPGDQGFESGFASASLDDSAWARMRIPNTWQSQGLADNGVVWFRSTVGIPSDWAGRDLELDLGCIDDFDTTYVNGIQVGAHPQGTPQSSGIRRHYRIPSKLVDGGRALIAVRVYDQAGDGGMMGPANAMFLSCPGLGKLKLDGIWAWKQSAVVRGKPVDWSSCPWPDYPQEQDLVAGLHNGMIAPVAGYGLRGVLWYQGESNAGEGPAYSGISRLYEERFRALIRGWRADWGQGDLPFYYVQLANFRANPGWPLLRESQEKVLSEPATGMAVTIDIGNPDDIHPRDKRTVADRLFRIALADTYGEQGVETSGPVRKSMVIRGNTVEVVLAHADGLHTRDGAEFVKGYELAGVDGVYHAASARISSPDRVLVTCAAVPEPRYLRYAFRDAPDTNLVNGEGLPARPFRTDDF